MHGDGSWWLVSRVNWRVDSNPWVHDLFINVSTQEPPKKLVLVFKNTAVQYLVDPGIWFFTGIFNRSFLSIPHIYPILLHFNHLFNSNRTLLWYQEGRSSLPQAPLGRSSHFPQWLPTSVGYSTILRHIPKSQGFTASLNISTCNTFKREDLTNSIKTLVSWVGIQPEKGVWCHGELQALLSKDLSFHLYLAVGYLTLPISHPINMKCMEWLPLKKSRNTSSNHQPSRLQNGGLPPQQCPGDAQCQRTCTFHCHIDPANTTRSTQHQYATLISLSEV